MRDQYSAKRGITLIELLISIVLMTMIVLSFASFDLYGRYHVLNADRRARVQNDVAFVLEHMTKQINRVMGDINRPGVVIGHSPPAITTRILIYMDTNNDGTVDSGTNTGYCYFDATNAVPNRRNRIAYCPPNSNIVCLFQSVTTNNNDISRKITNFNITPDPYNPNNNYLEIQLTGCYDPDGSPNACGTSDNPTVTMRTRIKMPSVSTN